MHPLIRLSTSKAAQARSSGQDCTNGAPANLLKVSKHKRDVDGANLECSGSSSKEAHSD